ncbi:MAG TPA: MFS transporter [Alphaproteobacteria bacterium]|nr:MFS transporter [Alphaproteobacteria bacterium]HAJ46856.1 MFS transporter [Alphaproteobacteria bacterium]
MRGPDEQGLPPRRAALAILDAVLRRGQSMSDALDAMPSDLAQSDAAFARAIAAGGLRRLNQIDAVLKLYLTKPLPAGSGPAPLILHAAATEILVLGAAPHAAVDCANKLAAQDRDARHFRGLINAILRKVTTEGRHAYGALDAALVNTPPWAWEDWSAAYGSDAARAIAEAHLVEAPLDFSLKDASQSAHWAVQLQAEILPTGSLRRPAGGRITALPGFAEGAWWVQDAAAALPVRLLGDVKGQFVLDLCAAPGGKTAQLCAAGARVMAVDRSPERLALVQENLKRLSLTASVVAADVTEWRPEALADAVLLDAPCTATGTIRRHPDLLINKARGDVMRLAEDQVRLLGAALAMVKPGGTLVYAVCSLQPEEGPEVVQAVLNAPPAGIRVQRLSAGSEMVGGQSLFLDALGDLRTLPSHWAERGGVDGFYAARLQRLPD